MPNFSKRHYEAIALAMQDAKPMPHWDPNKQAQWEVTRSRLAEMFAGDNGMFQRDRFIRACEPGAERKSEEIMAHETVELMGCTDCLFLVANGDYPPENTEEQDRALDAAIDARWAGYHLVCGDSEDDNEFSWTPCEVCGSNLGGARHSMAALKD